MIATDGVLLALGGLAIEGIAVTGTAFYSLLRQLPWSPLGMQSVGFLVFLAGTILAVLGQH